MYMYSFSSHRGWRDCANEMVIVEMLCFVWFCLLFVCVCVSFVSLLVLTLKLSFGLLSKHVNREMN
jgi:hypothetical protein